MKPSTVISLVLSGKGALLYSIQKTARSFNRACFVSAAFSSGLLKRLAQQPMTFEEMADECAPAGSVREGFRAWLDVGVMLGELARQGGRYRLRGRLSIRLAREENDAEAAFLEELVSLQHLWITQAHSRFRKGGKFVVSEQDGELFARSSRIVEPFVREAVDAFVPQRGAIRLFDVGCGSATYVCHAAERNPELTALALEVQPTVATAAQENVARWNLVSRVRVEQGDVRQMTPKAEFDLATLLNTIYYFPKSERVAVLSHLAGFLKPRGRVLLTSLCRNCNLGAEILNLWAALTEGCGPLPEPDEVVDQLRLAGFRAARAKNLFPTSGLFAFTAEK
jgi:SAM-dependent methyltransferase